jgi:tetratricopeptide (TPR) repeat protein
LFLEIFIQAAPLRSPAELRDCPVGIRSKAERKHNRQPTRSVPRWGWIGLSLAGAATLVGVLWWLSRVPPIPSDQLLAAGIEAAKQGNHSLAIDQLDQLLARDSDHPEALLYRGQIAYEQGELAKACELFRRVPDAPPRIGTAARYAEGMALVDDGLVLEAVHAFQQATEINPNFAPARERLVELYVALQRPADIRRELTALHGIRPWRLEELALYSTAGSSIPRDQPTLARVRKFAAADTENASLQRLLAKYLIAHEEFAEAEQIAAPLAARDASDAEAAGLLAEARWRQQNTAGAAAALAQVSPSATPDSWYLRGCSRVLLDQGDVALAAECAAAAARLAPEDLATIHQAGTTVGRVDPTAGQKLLEQAESLDRIDRQSARLSGREIRQLAPLLPILLEIAEALEKLERYPEAARWYQQLVELAPEMPGAREGFARVAPLARSQPVSSGSLPHEVANLPVVTRNQIHAKLTALAATEASSDQKRQGGATTPIVLRDVHEAAGLDWQYFNGDTGNKYLLESMGGGVAVLDYDRDGWPDLYLVQGCELPFDPSRTNYRDRLFRNVEGQRFEDVTDAAGLGDHRYGQGCAVGDYDGDGDPDLLVANYGQSILYRNNGDGTFTDVTTATGLTGEHWNSSAAFADFDGDGVLDLYLGCYVHDAFRICRGATGKVAACDPGNYAAEQDRLFQGRGDGMFVDVTDTSGIVAPDGKCLGILVSDLDDDGKPDIYVANDGTPNFLFHNRSQPGTIRFQEAGQLAGVAVDGEGHTEGSMGIAGADFDRDGRIDLYVTNFIDEMYTYYRNLGGLLFEDNTRRSGLANLTKPLVGFGVQPIDFDSDGYPDLLVANGHIDDFRFRDEPWKMPPQLFRNQGKGQFTDAGAVAGPYFQGEYLGRGMARLDWDRDGDDDAVIVHQDAPLALLSNETAAPGHWIAFRLRGTASHRDAVGARLEVHVPGEPPHIAEVQGGHGFFAANEDLVRIGLGEVDAVEKMVIRWPSGQTETIPQPAIDRVHTLIEGWQSE